MKTMKLRQKLEMRGCPKLRHLSVFIILSLLSYSSFSFEHKVGNSRTPASAFDEEVLTVPVEIKSISQTLSYNLISEKEIHYLHQPFQKELSPV